MPKFITNESESNRAASPTPAIEKKTNDLNVDEYRRLVQYAPVPILLCTPSGEIVFINKAFCKLLGYSKEEMVEKISLSQNLGMDEREFLKLKEELERDGEITNKEFNLKNRWGGIRKCLANLKIVEVRGESLIYMAYIDITERVKDEDQIRILKKAVEAANEAFIIADMTTTIIYCNRAATRIFGYEREELIGKDTSWIHTPQEEGIPDKEEVEEILKKTGKWSAEFVGRKKTGEPLILHESVSYIWDEKGIPYAMMGVVQDVTGMRKLEAELQKYQHKYKKLKKQIQNDNKPSGLVGTSPDTQRIRDIIQDVSTLNISVLICGETGTGKEMVANLLHEQSGRRDKPFVRINCGALSESLLETELFGHEKGAFTGAIRTRKGKCELANCGTLFLDEIGEISPRMQVALLRFLETGEIQRVGGEETLNLDVRVIAATNKDLGKAVKEGKFREDLFYRLNVLPIYISPLRERPEDIPILANYFLSLCQSKYRKKVEDLSDEVMNFLINYQWPGNVRELQNLIETLVVMAKDGRITLEFLRSQFPFMKKGNDRFNNLERTEIKEMPLKDSVKIFEKDLIKKLLKEENDNIDRVAKRLGICKTSVYLKLKNTDKSDA